MEILPPLDAQPKQFYGNVIIYSHKDVINTLEIPAKLKQESYFLDQNLLPPYANQKINSKEVFGTHFRTLNFERACPDKMKELLLHYVSIDFYYRYFL